MAKIWFIMLVSSIATLLFINPSAAVSAMLSGSQQSVELAINLVAVYGFWLGFFALLEKIGASNFIAKLLRPVIKFLFVGAKEDTQKYITMNMSANLLGLGNASTPMGINAINSMNDGKPYATTNMIMLIVISATSLQIIPSTVIGMRASHGSTNPTDFLIASVVATITSTVVGVALVKIISKFFPDFKLEKKENKTKKEKAKLNTKPGKTPALIVERNADANDKATATPSSVGCDRSARATALSYGKTSAKSNSVGYDKTTDKLNSVNHGNATVKPNSILSQSDKAKDKNILQIGDRKPLMASDLNYLKRRHKS